MGRRGGKIVAPLEDDPNLHKQLFSGMWFMVPFLMPAFIGAAMRSFFESHGDTKWSYTAKLIGCSTVIAASLTPLALYLFQEHNLPEQVGFSGAVAMGIIGKDLVTFIQRKFQGQCGGKSNG